MVVYVTSEGNKGLYVCENVEKSTWTKVGSDTGESIDPSVLENYLPLDGSKVMTGQLWTRGEENFGIRPEKNNTGTVGGGLYHYKNGYINDLRSYQIYPIAEESDVSGTGIGEIGNSTYRWLSAYLNNVYTDSIQAGVSSDGKDNKTISLNSPLVLKNKNGEDEDIRIYPKTNDTCMLGHNNAHFHSGWINEVNANLLFPMGKNDTAIGTNTGSIGNAEHPWSYGYINTLYANSVIVNGSEIGGGGGACVITNLGTITTAPTSTSHEVLNNIKTIGWYTFTYSGKPYFMSVAESSDTITQTYWPISSTTIGFRVYTISSGTWSYASSALALTSDINTSKSAASSNTSNKIYLIGRTSQSTTGGITYSHGTVYVGTDDSLHAASIKTLQHYAANSDFTELTIGDAGQVLTSDGTNNYWGTPAIVDLGTITTSPASTTNTALNSITTSGIYTFKYSNAQYLMQVSASSSTIVQYYWTNPSGTIYTRTCTVSSNSWAITSANISNYSKYAASGNTSNQIYLIGRTSQSTSGSTTYSHDTVYVDTDGVLHGDDGIYTKKITAPTSSDGTTYGTGSSGQVLMSNGSTTYWGTPGGSCTRIAANTKVGIFTSGIYMFLSTYSGTVYGDSGTAQGTFFGPVIMASGTPGKVYYHDFTNASYGGNLKSFSDTNVSFSVSGLLVYFPA